MRGLGDARSHILPKNRAPGGAGAIGSPSPPPDELDPPNVGRGAVWGGQQGHGDPNAGQRNGVPSARRGVGDPKKGPGTPVQVTGTGTLDGDPNQDMVTPIWVWSPQCRAKGHGMGTRCRTQDGDRSVGLGTPVQDTVTQYGDGDPDMGWRGDA